MSILQLLGNGNFITFSKPLAKKVGVNGALVLGVLCSYQSKYDGQSFYKDRAVIVDNTCLSKYAVRDALTELSEKGFIEMRKKGMPARLFYKVNEEKLTRLFFPDLPKDETLDLTNTASQDLTNTASQDLTKSQSLSTNKKDLNKKEINNKYIYTHTRVRDLENEKSVKEDLSSLIVKEDVRLQEPLREFVKMRKAIKKPLTAYALNLRLSELKRLSHDDIDTAIIIVNNSISHCWQAFYALKTDKPSMRINDGWGKSISEDYDIMRKTLGDE